MESPFREMPRVLSNTVGKCKYGRNSEMKHFVQQRERWAEVEQRHRHGENNDVSDRQKLGRKGDRIE